MRGNGDVGTCRVFIKAKMQPFCTDIKLPFVLVLFLSLLRFEIGLIPLNGILVLLSVYSLQV